jgi:hypothetical protein
MVEYLKYKPVRVSAFPVFEKIQKNQNQNIIFSEFL